MIFDMMKANDKNDYDAADIVCAECRSIIATLHAPSAYSAGGRTKKAAKALEMAGQEIDRLSDPSATDEERQRRKRRLLKGPKEFRDVRGNRRESPLQVTRLVRFQAPVPISLPSEHL
jgi:hypothetical protein